MNNIMLGGKDWAVYETIGGGSGGRPDSDGVDGVQVNMTNTQNTPAETIEATYPLRVVRYELRDNSGGRGLHRGGNGIIREIMLLRDTTVTVVGDRMRHGPWGLKGGEPGQTSYYSLVTRDDEIILGSKQTVKAKAGSVLRIFTPGGGGYGAPPDT
jgi:N-methylhydantoinase B